MSVKEVWTARRNNPNPTEEAILADLKATGEAWLRSQGAENLRYLLRRGVQAWKETPPGPGYKLEDCEYLQAQEEVVIQTLNDTLGKLLARAFELGQAQARS